MVGGRHSNNTSQLVLTAEAAGRRAYGIERAGELEPGWFDAVRNSRRDGGDFHAAGNGAGSVRAVGGDCPAGLWCPVVGQAARLPRLGTLIPEEREGGCNR